MAHMFALTMLQRSGSLPTILLFLTATATQQLVVRAQSSSNPYYYYWLTPGRIVGIAIGALVLILLIASLLTFAVRRHRQAKATNLIPTTNYPQQQPQAYPPWPEGQQQVQTPYVSPAVPSGWYYPEPPAPPQSAAPRYSEIKTTTASGQLYRPPISNQFQSTMPSDQAQGSVPSGQGPSMPAPSSEAQEQGPPPPVTPTRPYGNAEGTSSAGPAVNDTEQSPPPYYPPTGPPPPPRARTAR